MYILSLPFYMSRSGTETSNLAWGQATNPPPSWITQPRKTKKDEQCDPPLLCAWSIDHPRTQAVSLALWHKGSDDANKIPTAADSIASAAAGKPSFVETHLESLNKQYEQQDANFLRRTGIVHLDISNAIHVIPMGGEAYFHRSLRDADLILDGFLRNTDTANNFLPAAGQEWLDFGGSHGRIAQIMAAAYPETMWHVVDPIASTVDWAKARLPKLRFSVMTDARPPLTQYRDGQFTGIYALSIWSHYCEEAALVWLKEMHRLLKPGGRLWFSTHSYQALNYAMLDAAPLHPLRHEMMRELYQKGHYYFPMFGTQGDFGVSDQHGGSWWGFGAFTTEWLAANVLNGNPAQRWRLEYYGPGANENHQDVYVLSKLG